MMVEFFSLKYEAKNGEVQFPQVVYSTHIVTLPVFDWFDDCVDDFFIVTFRGVVSEKKMFIIISVSWLLRHFTSKTKKFHPQA